MNTNIFLNNKRTNIQTINEKIYNKTILFSKIEKYYLITDSNIYFVSGIKKGSKGFLVNWMKAKNELYGFKINFIVQDKDLLQIKNIEIGKVKKGKNIKIFNKKTIVFGKDNFNFINAKLEKNIEQKIINNLLFFLSLINLNIFYS